MIEWKLFFESATCSLFLRRASIVRTVQDRRPPSRRENVRGFCTAGQTVPGGIGAELRGLRGRTFMAGYLDRRMKLCWLATKPHRCKLVLMDGSSQSHSLEDSGHIPCNSAMEASLQGCDDQLQGLEESNAVCH
jgi:hypothetical protein